MEWLLLLLVAGGGGLAVQRWRGRSAQRREELSELEGIRQLADEDVTDPRRAAAAPRRRGPGSRPRPGGPGRLPDGARRLRVGPARRPRIRTADEVSTITDTLSSGRHALACVQARVAGAPVPELRVPCFFNPQHGPSVANVTWTQPGRGTRSVPACAQDLARVANHEPPDVRKVTVGSPRGSLLGRGQRLPPLCAGLLRGLGRDDVGVPAAARPGVAAAAVLIRRRGLRRRRVRRRWRVRRGGGFDGGGSRRRRGGRDGGRVRVVEEWSHGSGQVRARRVRLRRPVLPRATHRGRPRVRVRRGRHLLDGTSCLSWPPNTPASTCSTPSRPWRRQAPRPSPSPRRPTRTPALTDEAIGLGLSVVCDKPFSPRPGRGPAVHRLASARGGGAEPVPEPAVGLRLPHGAGVGRRRDPG